MTTLGDVFVELHVDDSEVKGEARKAGSTAGKSFNQGADKKLGGGGVFAAAPQSPEVEKGGRKGGRAMGGAFVAGASKALLPLAGVFGAAAVGNFFKGTISEASDVSESINAVRVTYGKAAEDVLKLGETSAKSFGLSKSELNGFAVQFSSFAQTIAGKGGDSAGVFEDITGRATDFASVMNIDVKQAAEIFQSGLAGETEPLKKFGINLSAAAVESHAVKEGIAAAGEEMTEAQKTQARYSLLMQETSKTQGDFANTSDGLANQQRILAARFTNVRAELGAKLLPLATKFFSFLNATAIPAAEAIVGWIGGDGMAGSFGKMGDTFSQVMGAIRPGLETLSTGFRNIAGAVLPILKQIGERLAKVFMENLPAIKAIITEVAAIVGKMFKVLGLYYTMMATTIKKVWSVIGPYVLDFLGFIIKNIVTILGGAVKIISGILTIWVGIFTGDFSKIKSGVVKILGGMWSIIRGLFSNQFNLLQKWLGGWITGMVQGFMNFWAMIVSGFLAKWRTLTTVLSWPFKVAARAINGALNWLLNKVIRPVVGFIVKRFQALGRGFRAVWRNFLSPVFQLVGAIVQWLWGKVTRPIFNLIEKAWARLGRGFRVVWRSFLRPIFRGVASIARWLWERVLRPVIRAIVDAWRWLGKLFRTVYRNTIGRVFTWFGNKARDARRVSGSVFNAIGGFFNDLGRGFRRTLNNLLRPVFRGFVNAGQWMSDQFKKVVGWIGNQWDRLKKLAAKPIRFVIDTVINKGLIGGFNKLATFFDTDKIKPLPVPFKSGGVLPGHSPGRDIHRFTSPTGGALDLSGGEAIMRPEFTRAVGGPRGVAALNRAARGFAQGGVFGELTGGSGSFTDRARQTLLAAQKLAGTQFNIFQRGHRPTTSYSGTSHAGDAVDLGPITKNVIRALRSMGWAAWDRTGMGNWVPHIHAVPLPGAGTAGGSGVWQAQDFLDGGNGLGGRDRGPRGIIGRLLGGAKNLLGAGANAIGGFLDPSSLIQKALSSAMNKFSQFADSPFTQMVGAVPKKIASTGIDWFTDKMSSLFGGSGGVASSWSGGGVGGWSKSQLDVASTIIATAKQAGVGRRGAKIGLMTALQESTLRELSGGDRDSVGPFQQRGPWGSFSDRKNAASAASMFFHGGQGGQEGLLDKAWRSMGLGEAAQAVQVSAYPGAYSKWADEADQILARAGHKFDDGGVWPSGTIGVNQSGKDEVVFTNEQWDILRRLVSQSQSPAESWPQPGDTVVFEVEGEPMTATATRVVRSEIKQASGSI